MPLHIYQEVKYKGNVGTVIEIDNNGFPILYDLEIYDKNGKMEIKTVTEPEIEYLY